MRWIGGLLILFVAVACTDHNKVPADIIGKEKMEKIMWDMVQADRFVNVFIMNLKDTLPEKRKQAAVFYERVFQLHGISRDKFIKSYKYYLSRPDISKVMFDSISSRAEKRKAEAHMSKNPILQKRDSLMRLDSIRKQDSIEEAELKGNTGEMSDSALRKALFDRPN